MNLYMRALGFRNMDAAKEDTFIAKRLENALKAGDVYRNMVFDKGVVVVQVTKTTGIYIYGRFEDGKFIYEYHTPFVFGRTLADNDELTVERHVDKESYAVVCDDTKTGVTLIFYLQNVLDYYQYISQRDGFDESDFSLFRRNAFEKEPIKGKLVAFTALSLGGMILLPIDKRKNARSKKQEESRRNLIAAAKKGDEDAIESLTLEDIDKYTEISHRILHEDVFSIVDSTFMPCGVECDQYSVVGEILQLEEETNRFTKEKVYVMILDCNNIVFSMAVNKKDVLGEPQVGRRFKGQIWLQGVIQFRSFPPR